MLLVAYITTMFSADIRYGLARAKLLSETDDLTGLLNVRGFALAANRLFAQAARHGRATSVLMIDSDNLKGVNDSHGHASGNRLLLQLAECIQASSVEERGDQGLMTEKLRVELRRFFKKRSGRRPLVLPVLMEI